MIVYPGGIKKNPIKKETSFKNRGKNLEYDINLTNQYYRDIEKAVIYKKPTPIQIVKVHYPKREAAIIKEAYYQTPSTTDFNGVYQGKAIDFEAKETKSKTSFSLRNIHLHQINHLKAVLLQKAIAFVIVRFTSYDETYYVKAEDMIKLYEGEKRLVPYTWFQEFGHLIKYNYAIPVDYLKIVDQLIQKGDKNG